MISKVNFERIYLNLVNLKLEIGAHRRFKSRYIIACTTRRGLNRI